MKADPGNERLISDPMPGSLPLPRKTLWARMRSWRWFRVGIPVILVFMILLFIVWLPRRGVWAVEIAGGRSFAFDRRFTENLQGLEGFFPTAYQPFWNRTEETIHHWLMEDVRISSVNLRTSRVDHRWMPHLKQMVSLELLSLHERQIGSGLESLGELAYLRALVIFKATSATPLQDLRVLKKLERITFINPQSPLRGLEELRSLSTLRRVEFAAIGEQVDSWAELLEPCRNWPSLEVMVIRSDHPLTPAIKVLQSCKSLTELDLSVPLGHSDLVDLAGMQQLVRLSVNARRLAREDLLLLGQLKNLHSLQVYSIGADRSLVQELQRLLPDCQIEIGP